MAELTSIVEQSMADAAPDGGDGGGDTIPDTDSGLAEEPTGAIDDGDSKETPVELDTTAEAPAAPVEAKAEPVKKEDTFEKDDLDKLLEGYGIKGPRKGQKEGVFKYSRFREVLGKEVKKVADKFEGDIRPLKERTTQIEAVERLIAADPQRYLTMLSQVHPVYRKYLEPPAAPKAAEPAKPAHDPNDAMPQPDAKFADGSPGYSPEQFHKYQEWRDRRVAASIKADLQKEFNARLTPYERQAQAAAIRAQEMPRVNATIAKMTERWGEIFTKDVGDVSKPNPNSVLMQHMARNPQMNVFEAAMDVYLPLKDKQMQARLDGQREAIHKELNGRPGAADRGGAAMGEKTTTRRANMSLTDIVREQMANADGQ
jgi:predicted flap endonuclease-1-like 5' DNA nuclease